MGFDPLSFLLGLLIGFCGVVAVLFFNGQRG